MPCMSKNRNILIPPLTIFYGKDELLKPEKIDNIINKNNEIQKLEVNKENQLFKKINVLFLSSILNTEINLENGVQDFKNIVE